MDTLAKVIFILIWLFGAGSGLPGAGPAPSASPMQSASTAHVSTVRTFDVAGALRVYLRGPCVAVGLDTEVAPYHRPLWWTPVPRWADGFDTQRRTLVHVEQQIPQPPAEPQQTGAGRCGPAYSPQ